MTTVPTSALRVLSWALLTAASVMVVMVLTDESTSRGLLVAVLALRLYARVVGTLDGIPLVSGLLELTGLIYLVWFSSTRLVRTSERERVLAEWKQRWQSFSGRS